MKRAAAAEAKANAKKAETEEAPEVVPLLVGAAGGVRLKPVISVSEMFMPNAAECVFTAVTMAVFIAFVTEVEVDAAITAFFTESPFALGTEEVRVVVILSKVE